MPSVPAGLLYGLPHSNFTFTSISLAKKRSCTKRGDWRGAKRSREAFVEGMEGQPKGLAWRNPAKPGFRHEGPEMRPNYMKNFCKCKTAVWSEGAGNFGCRDFPVLYFSGVEKHYNNGKG
jgi:hypothetical protein